MSPRCGSVPLHGGPPEGGMIDGIQYEGKKPKPAPQQSAKVSAKNSQHIANNSVVVNPQPNSNQKYYTNSKSNTKSNGGSLNSSAAKSYSTMQFDDGSKLPAGAKVVSDTVNE
jgi:hypothetical protein